MLMEFKGRRRCSFVHLLLGALIGTTHYSSVAGRSQASPNFQSTLCDHGKGEGMETTVIVSFARFFGYLLSLLLLTKAISATTSSAHMEVRVMGHSLADRPSGAGAPEIAIIGAGAGGAFTAHYLRELLGPRAAITVVEANKVCCA